MTQTGADPKGGVAPVSKRVMNLSHFVRQAARRYGQEIGLVWGGATWTWAEIDRRVDAMAAALAAKGVTKGDRVLVQSKNCNQMFESMFACFRLGGRVGAHQLSPDPERGGLSRAGERRLGYDLPQRFPGSRRGGARGGAGHWPRCLDRVIRVRRGL